MLIRLTDAFSNDDFLSKEHLYVDTDCITGIKRIEDCEHPHTKVYTSIKGMEICCVVEMPDHVVDLIENVRKAKDGIK